MYNELVIISGNAHPELGRRIAENLHVSLLDVEVGRFSDGEIRVKIKENIRGTDVFIVQPTPPPANNMMELLLLLDAVRRASCHRVTAVVPYFGYARQDRKDQPRGADRRASDGEPHHDGRGAAGADNRPPRAADPGLLRHPVGPSLLRADPPAAFPGLAAEQSGRGRSGRGEHQDRRAFAKRLDASLAIVDKRRPRPNEAVIMNFIGDVKGKDVIIFDDMIDTAGP